MSYIQRIKAKPRVTSNMDAIITQEMKEWRDTKPFMQGSKVLTRSSFYLLYDLDPEIEITLRRLRKVRNTVVSNSSSSNSDHSNFATNDSDSFEYNSVNTSCCIQYPQLEPAQTYELKSGLIPLLPKFHGLAEEDPHKQLKEIQVVFSTMRPQGIPEDYIKMKAFPFFLDGATKDWLYLQPVLFNT
ncbi:hypothetical protein CR513_42008, partial [Mucuna pruriens]